MAEVCHPCESNGVGESETQDISNINFGSVDAPNLVPLSYTIARGDNSFSKFIRYLFTGTWTDISNMKIFKLSGEYVTGELIKAAANQAYATPSQVDTGDSAIPIVLGSALAIESAESENHIEYGVSGVSGYTGYVRMQMGTTGASPSGAVNSKIIRFTYDVV